MPYLSALAWLNIKKNAWNSPKTGSYWTVDPLKGIDYVEGVDYGQVLKIRRQQMNRYKANNNGFGGNGTNWFGK